MLKSVEEFHQEVQKHQRDLPAHQQFRQTLCDFIRNATSLEICKELKPYLLQFVEQQHYVIRLYTPEYCFSAPAMSILNHVLANSTYHEEIVTYISDVCKFAEIGSVNFCLGIDHVRGFERMIGELENIFLYSQFKKIYQQDVPVAPDLRQALDQSIEGYLFNSINHKTREEQESQIEQLFKYDFYELIDVIGKSCDILHQRYEQRKPHTEIHYWVRAIIRHILSRKDKRMESMQAIRILLPVMEKFACQTEGKKAIKLIVHAIKTLYKKNQLASDDVDFIERHFKLNQIKFGIITAKEEEQIQQTITEIINNVRHKQILQTLGTENIPCTYELPFTDLSAAVGAISGDHRRGISWTRQLQAEFDALPNDQKILWQSFWQHIDSTTAKKPSKKWLSAAQTIFDSGIKENYANQLSEWIKLIIKESPKGTRPFSAKNENTIKGMLWFSLLLTAPQPQLLDALTQFSLFCYRKIQYIGATSMVVGNVCLYVLSQKGFDGLSKLSFLQKKIRYELGQKIISTALSEAAQLNGLSEDELKDVVLDDLEFKEGKSSESTRWQDYQLVAECTGEKQCAIAIYDHNGTRLLKEPKGFNSAQLVKELKSTCKAVQALLGVQVQRMEEAMVNQRNWQQHFWQTHVLEHGLQGWLAKRLIWCLHDKQQQITHAFYFNNQWINAKGEILNIDTAHIQSLSLWHPIFSEAAEVLAWRQLLVERQILQPFRQAFREVYVPTPAEINAETSSLRFAYHYLSQSQFKAIANGRQWSYDIQGGWDSFYHPGRFYPQHKISVSLKVAWPETRELLDKHGVYAYIKTQEIVFSDHNNFRSKPRMDDIPAIVFSEAMRDVDYFINSSSIGQDLSLEPYGFPDSMKDYYLNGYKQSRSQIVELRRDALDMIVSKLDIAPKCKFDQQFMYVQGQVAQYKIQLNSGHIFMQPNDQYLCIVPDKSVKDFSSTQLFLPFEHDAMLSLILSKAMLLSDDHLIQDELITRQIHRG